MQHVGCLLSVCLLLSGAPLRIDAQVSSVSSDINLEDYSEEAVTATSFYSWLYPSFWLNGRCPRGQNDAGYLKSLIDTLFLSTTSYLDYLPEDSTAPTVDEPGSCTTSYIQYASIKSQLEQMVQDLYDGVAYRFNDLGLIRLSNVPFDCRNSPWDDGYCGIALGMPVSDHVIVRPFVDELLGDGTIGGDQSLSVGNRWNLTSLRASAETYLAGRTTLDTGKDQHLWVVRELHKVTLNLDLTDEESQELVDTYSTMLIRGALPAFIARVIPFGFFANLRARRKYIAKYETAIRALIADGSVTTLVDEGDNVKKAAWTLWDAYSFAGFPSVTSVIAGALGSYYNGQVDDTIDLETPIGMGLVIFETARMYPPVLGVTRIDKASGQRIAAVAGLNGYDKTVWGADALEFRVRMDFATYKSTSLNWADAALPVAGILHTNHVCPAKSFSFNLVLAFLLALNPEQWTADEVAPVPEPGKGPTFWDAFTLTAKP